MRQNAAQNIDKEIAKAPSSEGPSDETPKSKSVDFVPVKPARRRPGTGCISQINDNLWEGRYSPKWPDGKKHSRNIYAHTREECEEKLKSLIPTMNAEIAAERAKVGA